MLHAVVLMDVCNYIQMSTCTYFIPRPRNQKKAVFKKVVVVATWGGSAPCLFSLLPSSFSLSKLSRLPLYFSCEIYLPHFFIIFLCVCVFQRGTAFRADFWHWEEKNKESKSTNISGWAPHWRENDDELKLMFCWWAERNVPSETRSPKSTNW